MSKEVASRSEERFPFKDNKRYYLHTLAPKGTFIIDLMFEHRKFCYLVAINVNTRKLWFASTVMIPVAPSIDEESEAVFEKKIKIAMKDSASVVNALRKIIDDGAEIKYIKSDGESAFKTLPHVFPAIKFEEVGRQELTKFPEWMSKTHIAQMIAKKSEPKHTSLALIDRAIRTLRDMAYNVKKIITPEVMTALVWQYNCAPHKTLSKYAGQPVSPNDVDENEDLQRFIMRRMQQDNYEIMTQPGFNLNIGTPVRVFNERNALTKRRSEIIPGNWVISGKKGVLYELTNKDNGDIIKNKSRFQLDWY